MNSYDVSASLRDADVGLGETDLHVVMVSSILPLALVVCPY
jgi:hypothetical protein